MARRIQFEQLNKGTNNSFFYKYYRSCYKEEMPLHQHSELELTYIIKGGGIRIVEEFVETFRENEILFFPSNVPHCWIFDEYDCGNDGMVEEIVVQFSEEFMNHLSCFPELSDLCNKIKRVSSGLEVIGRTADDLRRILFEMEHQTDAGKLASFIRLVSLLAYSKEIRYIGNTNLNLIHTHKEMERMRKIYSFVAHNYRQRITLKELSEIACMSQSAFCTFFKHVSGKTFFTFLNEYRIETACTLLRITDKSVSEICYSAGFNDIPHFNRVFKKLKSLTPQQYRSTVQCKMEISDNKIKI